MNSRSIKLATCDKDIPQRGSKLTLSESISRIMQPFFFFLGQKPSVFPKYEILMTNLNFEKGFLDQETLINREFVMDFFI